MSMTDYYQYNGYLEIMNRSLAIWGQPCRVYCPDSSISLGYENTTQDINSQNTGVTGLGAKYTTFDMNVFINFKTTKSVFYRFNYFPDNQDDLVVATMEANSKVRENCYIRTALPEQVSVWGDLMFKVQKMQDVGMYRTLQRIYFLLPTSNADLHMTLDY